MVIYPTLREASVAQLTAAHIDRLHLNRYMNRVVVIGDIEHDDQRTIGQTLADQLNALAHDHADWYAYAIPYRVEVRLVPKDISIIIPYPPEQPVIPEESPDGTKSEGEQSTTDKPDKEKEKPSSTPEDPKAAQERRLAELRMLAQLEAVTVGTVYIGNVPSTIFTGTLFNRHDKTLKRAVVRLDLFNEQKEIVVTKDFPLVPFQNPSIHVSGLLPSKHRFPFTFPLGQQIPGGWTPRALLIEIEFDEPKT